MQKKSGKACTVQGIEPSWPGLISLYGLEPDCYPVLYSTHQHTNPMTTSSSTFQSTIIPVSFPAREIWQWISVYYFVSFGILHPASNFPTVTPSALSSIFPLLCSVNIWLIIILLLLNNPPGLQRPTHHVIQYYEQNNIVLTSFHAVVPIIMADIALLI